MVQGDILRYIDMYIVFYLPFKGNESIFDNHVKISEKENISFMVMITIGLKKINQVYLYRLLCLKEIHVNSVSRVLGHWCLVLSR